MVEFKYADGQAGPTTGQGENEMFGFTNNIGAHEICGHCGNPIHQYGDPHRRTGDNYCGCSATFTERQVFFNDAVVASFGEQIEVRSIERMGNALLYVLFDKGMQERITGGGVVVTQ
jgi:hypothetical protein